jgi:multisubunit Na+/H+ antiporter MnhC subunit
MNADLSQLFWVSGIACFLLLTAGVYYLLITFNLIRALIGVELMIKAVTLFIALVGRVTGREGTAQAIVITLIVIEVVIMVVAGGLVLGVFQNTRSISTRRIRNLKG